MDMYRSVFDNAPDSVILVDKQGRIVSVNFECERAMGYGKGELMGVKIETLIPSRFAEGHVQLREGYFDAPHRRSMGSGMKLFAQRKDGSEFPVDIMINLADTETGPIVIAIIRDLTERIEFESKQALLTATLEGVLKEIKVLHGLLPICAHCKKIRDVRGDWQQMEVYIRDHSDANFSHGICPTCIETDFPGFLLPINEDK